MSDIRALFTSLEHQNNASEKGLTPVPDSVIRQELITYIITEDGLKRITRTRAFRQSTHDEHYIEEVLRSSR